MILLLVMQVAGTVHASSFSYKGFVNQGFIISGGNNYLGESKKGSFDFGEAGINFYYRPINRLYFSAQISTRNVGDHKSGEEDLRLDYGLLGLNLYSGNQYDASLRLGRFKYFYGLYNDIQDISSAIPGVMPPQIMYYEYVLPDLTIDGVQLNQSFRFDELGTVNFDMLYGKPAADEREFEENLFNDFLRDYSPYSNAATGEVNSYDGLGALRLQYLTPDNSLLIGYIHTVNDGTLSLTASNSNYWFNGVGDGYSDTLSVEYVSDVWTFTSEYRTRFIKQTNTLIFLPMNLTDSATAELRTEAYYFQFRYQLTQKLEGLFRYEAYFANKHDRDGAKWSSQSAARQGKEHYQFSKDWVIGATYNFNDNFTLKSELHLFDGSHLNYAAIYTGATENDINQGLDRYWNMFLVELTYSF